MTWASHIVVGAATAKLLGLSIPLVTLGAILPDLIEKVSPTKVKHRGISHSLALWSLLSVILWWTPLRDVLIGVLVGHLLMDSLTVMGIPVFAENSKKLVLFGGKIRTGSAGEFAISGILAFLSFFVFSSFNINQERIDWQELHQDKVIDKQEYRENRFKLF